ncbi:MAG TPA: hypothetical protein VK137_03410, partial [Planctomycetaceae bacterium]|nr:hypothetical protein [Planctomycetaceae bacterium]
EGTTRADKPKSKPTAPTSLRTSGGRQPVDASSSPPSTSRSGTTKAGTKAAEPTTNKPAKSVLPPTSSAADNEPDIVVENEFDGIEVEEPAGEFDGIEIENEKDKKALPDLPAEKTGPKRSLAALLAEVDDEPLAPGIDQVSLGSDDHDEPVLRLHDDDDDDVIPGIEIDEEAPAQRPSPKSDAGK